MQFTLLTINGAIDKSIENNKYIKVFKNMNLFFPVENNIKEIQIGLSRKE